MIALEMQQPQELLRLGASVQREGIRDPVLVSLGVEADCCGIFGAPDSAPRGDVLPTRPQEAAGRLRKLIPCANR
jgi:hypothetical protein